MQTGAPFPLLPSLAALKGWVADMTPPSSGEHISVWIQGPSSPQSTRLI